MILDCLSRPGMKCFQGLSLGCCRFGKEGCPLAILDPNNDGLETPQGLLGGDYRDECPWPANKLAVICKGNKVEISAIGP